MLPGFVNSNMIT